MIIGIIGPKHSGKTTLKDLLVERHSFIHIAFATPIKKMLIQLVKHQGATHDHAMRMFYGDLKGEPSPYLGGKTPVFAMQTIGTEWGRELMHEDLWCDIGIKTMRYLDRANIVFDDVRFVNEADGICAAGGVIVRVQRDGYEPDVHRSEHEYKYIEPDITVPNNGRPADMLLHLSSILP